MTNKKFNFMERRIAIGMIISTDYLSRIHKFWDSELLESNELKLISDWCMDYYKKYDKAPDRDIQQIYMENLKKNIFSKDTAEYIELLLESLSDEYGRDALFNSAYLYDKTVEYLKMRELEEHNAEVDYLIQTGQVHEAEVLASNFISKIKIEGVEGLELSSEEALDRVERAFNETTQRVLYYPGAIGDMWNEHLIRGGFVSFLAPEKRGKSWLLIEMAMRAIRQKANVVFFSAGDMTESQMLKRICVYIAQKSDLEKYCQDRFCSVGDCVLNQLDLCDRLDRNCDHGIFNMDLNTFFQNKNNLLDLDILKEKYEENSEYCPCDSMTCGERRGSVWLKKIPAKNPLNSSEAKRALKAFFKRYKRRFKLVTHPAGMLTLSEMKKILNGFEQEDGFVPDVILVDYADLLSAEDSPTKEFRHKQDHVWKGLRALSQEKHALVLTATQADAQSYKQDRLSLMNFSEDKRKYAHVTAQYGLNQDPQGREKKLGIMRINEIVVREGEFSPDKEVYILQDLSAGRPFLESF